MILWRLREEVFDQTTVVLIFDSGEQSGSQFSDRRRLIERQAIVHLAAAEMTWHALRLKDWF
jgi:hypothetical protein